MLKKGVLYAITDSAYKKIPLTEQVRAAAEGGASLIQLREKGLGAEEYAAKARELLKITREYGVPLIINDSVEAALESGADGVHLGQSDGSPVKARELLGASAIIGVTAKTVSQAVEAERSGADYLGSGAVFVSPTKPAAVALSMEELSRICAAVSIPVYAIGGINEENMACLAGSGISGIAAVSAVFSYGSVGEIRRAAERLRTAAEGMIYG